MIDNIVVFLFRLFVIFGFLFEIPIREPLTSRRLSVFIAIITLVIRRKQLKILFSHINKGKLHASLLLFVLCLLLVFFNSQLVPRNTTSSYMEPWHMINLLLYVLVFSFYCVVEFRNLRNFVYVYSTAFLIQSVAVFYAAVNDSFRLYLYTNFYSGDDRFERSIELGTRIMGIALNSSQGSVICSTCIILLTFALIEKAIPKILYYSLCAIFVPMTMFIGRTGALIEVIVILYYVYSSGSKKLIFNSFIVVTAGLFVVFILSQILSNIDSTVADHLASWMTAIFDSEDRQNTLDHIHKTLPGLSSEFILGTGVRGGVTPDGNVVESDSGYIINYSALGIVGSLMYYIANLKMYKMSLSVNILKQKRRFFILLIIISFLIEYKEPFMMKYVFSYMIITTGLYSVLNCYTEKEKRLDQNILYESSNRRRLRSKT